MGRSPASCVAAVLDLQPGCVSLAVFRPCFSRGRSAANKPANPPRARALTDKSWQLIAGVVLLATAVEAASREAEDYLEERWYRLEFIVFERGPADDTVRRVTVPEPYPQGIMPLTNASSGDAALAFAPEPTVRDADAAFFSDRPPPLWLVGECIATHWTPPNDWSDNDGVLPRDPCLPAPPAPLATTSTIDAEDQDAEDEGVRPPAPPPVGGPSPWELARRALTEAFAQYERTLHETSYVWHPNPSGLRTEINRLERRFDLLGAGSWHQALPPRGQPQPLLVQVGERDGRRPFDVEGWIAVTVGRFVHFEVRLWVRLDDAKYALVNESRRLRSGEVHYLDHPVLGMLVRAGPVDIPSVLREQAERLDAFER